MPGPICMGLIHGNRNARAWPDRAPSVPALGVKSRHKLTETLGRDRHATANARREGDIDFVNINHQRLTIPVQATGPDGKARRRAPHAAAAALRHGPAFSGGAVQSDIDGTKVLRVGYASIAGPCPRVIGRKDTSDKGDDRQAMATIVA